MTASFFSDLTANHTKHIIPVLLASLLCLLPVPGFPAEDTSPIEKALLQHLVCPPGHGLDKTQKPLFTRKPECLTTIYLGTGKQPLWVTEKGATENGWIILYHLRYSTLHGLNSDKYNLQQILKLWPSGSPEDLAKLDTLLSYGLVRYIHDITQGQIEPRELDPELFAEAGALDFDPLLAVQRCLAAHDLNGFLTRLAPQHHHYKNLKAALERYRNIEHDGGWLPVPDGRTLHPDDSDPRIKAVRLRLLKTDLADIDTPLNFNSLYDSSLRDGVIRFQTRHNMDPDGIIGPQTLAAMNVSVAEHIKSIRLNLARWHWQSHNLGERYVIVNIAAFHLRGIQGQQVELEMPVIVGKQQYQTPVFSDMIRYLDFNPYWTIPPNIAKNEELPQLKKNPNHLVENHIRLFSGWQDNDIELDSTLVDWNSVTPQKIASLRLRQDPGPWNALGKLKFVFPNSYFVYMHGTPAQDLFSRNTRNFSHGCIRVSAPAALARFTLHGQQGNWTPAKIQELYEQNERKTVPLSHPVPVHITYQTCWVDKDGMIHFNRDIYARDKKLRNALY